MAQSPPVVPADILVYVSQFLEHAADFVSLALVSKRFFSVLLEKIRDPSSKQVLNIAHFTKPTFRAKWRPLADRFMYSIDIIPILPNDVEHGLRQSWKLHTNGILHEFDKNHVFTASDGYLILALLKRQATLESQKTIILGAKHGIETGEDFRGKFSRNWVHDKLEGMEQAFFSSGKTSSEQMWHNNKREGPYFLYYPTGRLHITRTFADGLEDGKEEVYYKYGEKKLEVHWKAGVKHGMETEWQESGVLKREVKWEQNRMIFETQYNEAGEFIKKTLHDNPQATRSAARVTHEV